MKKYILVLTLLMFKMYCFGQTVKSSDLQLTIYPSSGGEIGYVIEIKDRLLKVVSKKIISENNKIALGESKEVKELKLSNRQFCKVQRYLSELQNLKKKYTDVDLILDAWIFDFLINNEKSLKINSQILGESSDLKRTRKLVKYLRKISPIEIDLRDFS